jgi:hypothetical protein
MTIFFPDPLKDLFQRITTHRKERERGKGQAAEAERGTRRWVVVRTESVFRHIYRYIASRRWSMDE